MLYAADFETTTNPEDCRVWAWAVSEIGNKDNFQYGNSIDSFVEFMRESDNSTFYFHNLKFDSEFLFNYLFSHGFHHVKNKEDEASNTFTTLISDMGQFFATKIIFKKVGRRVKYAQLYDSLKILPFSVAEIAKAFALPISKLELDYETDRPVGHVLTQHEIDYIRNDVEIVASALKLLHDQNLTKMTQAGNAFFDYKETVGERNFDRWFPDSRI